MSTQDLNFPNVPADCIAALTSDTFNNEYYVSASSWDNTNPIWKISPQTNQVSGVASFTHSVPVLTSALVFRNQSVYTGTVDGTVSRCNLADNSITPIYRSEGNKMIKAVRYLPRNNLLAIASYDQTVKIIDLQSNNTVFQIKASDRITAFDATDDFAMLGIGIDKYAYIDFKNPVLKEHITPNKTNTTTFPNTSAVACFKTNSYGGAIGNIEGRVLIEHINNPTMNLPFRAHKTSNVLNMITCLDFHPKDTIIATAGTDGTICFWNYAEKARCSQYGPFDNNGAGPKCISASCFTADGLYYVYANSYNSHRGYMDPDRSKPSSIRAHKLINSDYKPVK